MKVPITITKEDEDRYKEHRRMLYEYYKYLFPMGNVYNWLSHKDAEYFSRREFALVKWDVQRNKIYNRFNSYTSLYNFRKGILEKKPHTIEIGASMNKRPLKLAKPWYAVEKELVFDIDVSDYDEVRTCCSGANICRKCWKFMVVACKILHMVLHDDFGFEKMLWVFSGRRGIHCWVCDESARTMTQEQRVSLLNYLTLPIRFIKGNDDLQIKWEHPLIQRTLNVAKVYFEEVCLNDQNIFSSWTKIENILVSEIPGKENCRNLRYIINDVHKYGSAVIWSAFCSFVESLGEEQCDSKVIESIQLFLLYPRLDLNVTKHTEHLLKTPFSIHPETQKVAIPFDPSKIESFDANTVPTLPILIRGIRSCLKKRVPTKIIPTSLLYPALIIFRDFVLKM